MRFYVLLLLLAVGCRQAGWVNGGDRGIDWDGVPASIRAADGFDPHESTATDRPGDRVLYDVVARQGTDTRHFLMLIEITDEPVADASTMSFSFRSGDRTGERSFPVTAVAARVSRFEIATGEVSVTQMRLPRETFCQNAFQCCEYFEREGIVQPFAPSKTEAEPNEGTPKPVSGGSPRDESARASEAERRVAYMLASTTNLFQSAIRDKTLREVILDVVGRPSIASLVAGVFSGFSVSFSIDVTAAQPKRVTIPGLGSSSGYAIPATISFNRDVVMNLSYEVIESTPPLHPTLGVARVHGIRVGEPEHTVTISLIGARRGPPRAPAMSMR